VRRGTGAPAPASGKGSSGHISSTPRLSPASFLQDRAHWTFGRGLCMVEGGARGLRVLVVDATRHGCVPGIGQAWRRRPRALAAGYCATFRSASQTAATCVNCRRAPADFGHAGPSVSVPGLTVTAVRLTVGRSTSRRPRGCVYPRAIVIGRAAFSGKATAPSRPRSRAPYAPRTPSLCAKGRSERCTATPSGAVSAGSNPAGGTLPGALWRRTRPHQAKRDLLIFVCGTTEWFHRPAPTLRSDDSAR
jgi:hypothetical protein